VPSWNPRGGGKGALVHKGGGDDRTKLESHYMRVGGRRPIRHHVMTGQKKSYSANRGTGGRVIEVKSLRTHSLSCQEWGVV